MRYLCWICGRQGLIPRSLEVEVHYDQKEHPLCNGGFADVWKGRRNGREVAVKVLRVYLTSDLERIRKVGFPRLACVNGLTVFREAILQGGYDVEKPSSSERVAAVGSDGERGSACDDIGMDG